LRKHRSDANAIMAKIERYAATGAGKVTDLVGRSGKRLRVGDFRVLFEEDATTIRVSRIGPRGEIYESGDVMKHTIVVTPSGEELVLLARADFETMREMIDAAAHATTMASVARGEQEMLTAQETTAALAAPTPLAFWRVKRGLTQRQLGQTVGVSQSYVADLEAGRRKGEAALIKRLAQALHLRMEDLVLDDARETPAARVPREK
jgi:DNA-binding XRE family transcriptional regulator